MNEMDDSLPEPRLPQGSSLRHCSSLSQIITSWIWPL